MLDPNKVQFAADHFIVYTSFDEDCIFIPGALPIVSTVTVRGQGGGLI